MKSVQAVVDLDEADMVAIVHTNNMAIAVVDKVMAEGKVAVIVVKADKVVVKAATVVVTKKTTEAVLVVEKAVTQVPAPDVPAAVQRKAVRLALQPGGGAGESHGADAQRQSARECESPGGS